MKILLLKTLFFLGIIIQPHNGEAQKIYKNKNLHFTKNTNKSLRMKIEKMSKSIKLLERWQLEFKVTGFQLAR